MLFAAAMLRRALPVGMQESRQMATLSTAVRRTVATPADSIKIYHVAGTRSVRVIWLCEELGLNYERVTISFSKE